MWLMKPSLNSGGDSRACVSQMLPYMSMLKRWSQGEGTSGWLVWTTGLHHGKLEPEGA